MTPEPTLCADGAWARRFVLMLACLTAALILPRLAGIGDRVLLDPNEGWNAFHALDAMGAGPLYPPAGALTANNYPPLSFYLVGAVGKLTGDMIVAGRLVALLALLAVAGSAALTVRRVTGRAFAAVLAGLAVLLFAVSVFRGYLAMNDPQWLSLAFSSAGLAIAVWPAAGKRLTLPAALAVAALMAAALLTKHNALAVPAAVGLYFALYDRRALLVCAIAAAAALPLVWLADRHLFGGAMLAGISGAPRSYSLGRMAVHALIAVPFLPMLAAAWPLARHRAADRRIDAILIGLGLSLILAIVQGSGAGVDVNAWFEALFVVAIAFGAGIALPGLPAKVARWLPWVLAFVAAALAVFGIIGSVDDVRHRSARLADVRAATDRIAAVRGPVACEVQALCYWAGKSFALDYFLYGEAMKRTGSTATLDRALADRRIVAAVIEGPPDRDLPPAQRHLLSVMRVVSDHPQRRIAVLR